MRLHFKLLQGFHFRYGVHQETPFASCYSRSINAPQRMFFQRTMKLSIFLSRASRESGPCDNPARRFPRTKYSASRSHARRQVRLCEPLINQRQYFWNCAKPRLDSEQWGAWVLAGWQFQGLQKWGLPTFWMWPRFVAKSDDVTAKAKREDKPFHEAFFLRAVAERFRTCRTFPREIRMVCPF